MGYVGGGDMLAGPCGSGRTADSEKGEWWPYKVKVKVRLGQVRSDQARSGHVKSGRGEDEDGNEDRWVHRRRGCCSRRALQPGPIGLEALVMAGLRAG
jgi:hypothetical protein